MAGDPCGRAQYAQLGASVAIVRIKRIADEAAITWLVVFPSAEQSNLDLELRGRGRNQRTLKVYASLVDEQSGGEIIGAVDDEVVVLQQTCCIAAIDPDRLLADLDKRVERAGEFGCSLRFRLAALVVTIDQLPLQVRALDLIVVDDRQPADAGCGKCRGYGTADRSGTHDRDPSSLEAMLADSSDLGKNDLPSVTIEFLVAQHHRPVEPKPPLPRSVSCSSATSTKAARRTGAGTS